MTATPPREPEHLAAVVGGPSAARRARRSRRAARRTRRPRRWRPARSRGCRGPAAATRTCSAPGRRRAPSRAHARRRRDRRTPSARTSARPVDAEGHRAAGEAPPRAPSRAGRRRWPRAPSPASAPSSISAFASAMASTVPKYPRCACRRWSTPARPARRCRPARGSRRVVHAELDDRHLGAVPAVRAATAAGRCGCSGCRGCAASRYRARQQRRRGFLGRRLAALPVIATTRAPDARRTARASACSARSVSSTTIDRRRAAPAAPTRPPALTTTPHAPRASASPTNVVAVEARRRAARRTASPGASVRVSVENAAHSRVRRRPPAGGRPRAGDHRRAASSGHGVSASRRLLGRHAARRARQRRARDLDVVERQRAVADDLVLLVPLAGDQRPGRPAAPRRRRARWPRARSTIAIQGTVCTRAGWPSRASGRSAARCRA